MPIHIRQLEWANHNAQRNYPLTIEATKQDLTGSFEIPDEFIISLYLAVHSGLNVDPTKFYLRYLGNHSTGFSLTVGYDAAGGAVNVATANIARASHVENQSYRLTGIGDFLDATGVIMLGRLDAIDDQPAGQFEFDPAGARLESDCVHPQIRGIPSLRVRNGTSLSNHLYDTVVLEAGRNTRLTVVQALGQPPRIVLDAIEGEGLNEECVCDDTADYPPIRTLNGIPGTAAGDFTLLGNDCLEWLPITNGLQANDKCSKPCCGCTELEIVTAQLEQFGRAATTLENLFVNVQARVTQMDSTVLGARLGDRGCAQC